MGSKCNIISLTKVSPTLDGNDIEFGKIHNAIYENNEMIKFIESLPPESTIADVIHTVISDNLINDIILAHYNKFNDITVDLSIDNTFGTLKIMINLLVSDTDNLMNVDNYTFANDLNDKYEDILISAAITDNIEIDFNIMMKNEYTRIVTIYNK